jgi:cell division protein FtsB
MVTRKRLRTTLQTLALYVGSALLIGYFWINAHSGNLGLRAKRDLSQQETDLLQELDKLKTERTAWQRRVMLLRPAAVDPDTLDERARAQLDYAHPRDLVMILKPH